MLAARATGFYYHFIVYTPPFGPSPEQLLQCIIGEPIFTHTNAFYIIIIYICIKREHRKTIDVRASTGSEEKKHI